MSDTDFIRKKRLEITPGKVGLALQVLGHYLMGAGAITSVSGTKTAFITTIVWVGFFLGGFGGFISTLYTNGSTPVTPLASTTVTQVSVTKQVDGPLDRAQTPKP